jgi:hypothetical protein
MKVLLVLFSCFYSLQHFAAEISGRVTDEIGTPLPFATIYLKGTSIGCASNEDGYYSLQVSYGQHILVFQYIGYAKKEIAITIDKEKTELYAQLHEETTILQEVVIDNSENPAIRIIKEAIARREEHLKEIQSFSCDVYIKGLQKITDAPDEVLGVKLNTILDLDSNNTGVIYFSESSSKFYYQYPDKTKEFMYASKRSGDNSQFSWNDAASMQFTIYENLIDINGLSERSFVSPIAANALFFYDYKLEGSVTENNMIQYKIACAPKRKSDPAFSGHLYITDRDYRIIGIQLYITKQNGIEFIDTLTVKQEFAPVLNNWVLLSNQFSFSYNIFGIKGNGYFNAFYNNYIFNPLFKKNFFDAEISAIEEQANKKSDAYWDSIRPVLLTEIEIKDYHEKDSLYAKKNTPAYKDSVDREFNKVDIMNLLTGYAYRNTNKNLFITTSGIMNLLEYNTVDGYVLEPAVTFTKTWNTKQKLSLSPRLHYGFGSKNLSADGFITVEYNPEKFATLSIGGGKKITQFNPAAVSPGINSFYTLFLEKNLSKLYQKQYFMLNHTFEAFNGFYLDITSEYAHRTQLYNTTPLAAYFDYESRSFTSNNFSFAPDGAYLNMKDKFTCTIHLRYVIGQKYMREPGKKYILDEKYPIIKVQYEKAIGGILQSAVAYDYISCNLSDKIKMRLAGNLSYELLAGNFLNERNMSIADVKHFSGNETFINMQGAMFLNLPYYAFSTTEPFFEAHIAYHTEGFLFNKLPIFKQFKLQPVFSYNALFTGNVMGTYHEFSAGIEHVFKLLRFDLCYTPYRFDDSYDVPKFRFVIGLGF